MMQLHSIWGCDHGQWLRVSWWAGAHAEVEQLPVILWIQSKVQLSEVPSIDGFKRANSTPYSTSVPPGWSKPSINVLNVPWRFRKQNATQNFPKFITILNAILALFLRFGDDLVHLFWILHYCENQWGSLECIWEPCGLTGSPAGSSHGAGRVLCLQITVSGRSKERLQMLS